MHPMMTPNLTLPPQSPPPPNGDCIGTESCIDLENDKKFEFDDTSSSAGKRVEGESSNSRRRKERREFPPPIPLLARTENLHPHMPWILKRYYTNDGRLILTEEKVRHHEYFRAHRANGRLTLQLVPLDEDVFGTLPPNHDNYDLLLQGTSPRDETNLDQCHSLDSLVDEQHKNINVDEGSDSDMEDVGGANATTSNPLNCSRLTSDSPCIFGVPVHAIG
ncbi:hypothetical protein L6164_030550 [Bauhinia variegata]|uniref:Uncharacterized protein n=1 Tax=Bauhinia variegata TaxID=167791 RepID=A0ACB9LCT5_BAUVA|nr:hypothetical protein L6164_030550 [Bauhinia variegata]